MSIHDNYSEQAYAGEYQSRFVSQLPPGLGAQENLGAQGIFKIKVGDLLWLNSCIKHDNIKIKAIFWGEKNPKFMLRAENTCLDEANVTSTQGEYHIQCGILQFYQYLQDMGRLRVYLVDKRCNKAIGIVMVNFLLYLKRNMNPEDTSPFDDISQDFPIHKLHLASEKEKNPAKIGELTLNMNCIFESQTKLKQLREQRRKNKRDPSHDAVFDKKVNFKTPMVQERNTDSLLNTRNGDMPRSLAARRNEARPYQNPFGQDMRRSGNYTDPFSEEIDSTSENEAQTQFKKKLEDIINPGKDLYERMLKAEEDGLSGSIGDYGRNSSNAGGPMGLNGAFSPSFSEFNRPSDNRDLNVGGLRSKEAELARVNFVMSDPRLALGYQSPNDPFFGQDQQQQAYGKGDISQTVGLRPLELKEIDKTKLSVEDFVCSNPLLKTKLKDQRVKLIVQFPGLNNSQSKNSKKQEIIEDTYNFINRGGPESAEGVYLFNQEIVSATDFKEGGLGSMGSKKIKFFIKAKEILPSSPNQGQFVTVCSGTLKIEDIIVAKEYSIDQKVAMFQDSNFNLDVTSKKNRKPKKKLYGSAKGPEDKKEEVGHLNIVANMFSTQRNLEMMNSPAQTGNNWTQQPFAKKGATQPGAGEILPMEPSGRMEFNSRYKDDPILPVCLFLQIKNSEMVVPRDHPSLGNRNLYLEHKIFGTPDSVRSNVHWQENCPIFDYKISMALNLRKIKMTQVVPLTVSVWDKVDSSSSKDDLLGFSKIPLKSIYAFLGHLDAEEIKEFSRDQKQGIVTVCEQVLPIQSLVLNDLKGYLNVYVGMGSIRAIEDYKKRLSEMGDSQSSKESRFPFLLKNGDRRLTQDPKSLKWYQKLNDGSKVEMEQRKVLDGDGNEQIVFTLADRSQIRDSEDGGILSVSREEEDRTSKRSKSRKNRIKGSDKGELGVSKSGLNNIINEMKSDSQIINDSGGSKKKVNPLDTFRGSDGLDNIKETSEIYSSDGSEKYLNSGQRERSKIDKAVKRLNTPNKISNSNDIYSELKKMNKDVSKKHLNYFLKRYGIEPSEGGISKDQLKQIADLFPTLESDQEPYNRDESGDHTFDQGNTSSEANITDFGEGEQVKMQKNSGKNDQKFKRSMSIIELSQVPGNKLVRIPSMANAASRKNQSVYKKDTDKNPNSITLSQIGKNSSQNLVNGKKGTQQSEKSKFSNEKDGTSIHIPSRGSKIRKNPNDPSHSSKNGKSSTFKKPSKIKMNTPSREDSYDMEEEEEENYDDYLASDIDMNTKNDVSNHAKSTEEGITSIQKEIGKRKRFFKDKSEPGRDQEAEDISNDAQHLYDSEISKSDILDKSKSRSRSKKNNRLSSQQLTNNNLTDLYGDEREEDDEIISNINEEEAGNNGAISKFSTKKSKSNQRSRKDEEEEYSPSEERDDEYEQTVTIEVPDKSIEEIILTEEKVEAKKMPQFETEIHDTFVSADVLASYTFMLEYMRRFLHENPELLENFDRYLMGSYHPEKTKFIGFSDFEQILCDFDVNITQEEAKPLFKFLDMEDKRDFSGRVDLSKIHDSLLAFTFSYDKLNSYWFDPFKYIASQIDKYGQFENLVDYLSTNADNFYIPNTFLLEFLKERFKVNIELVDEVVISCGENVFYEHSYIFNILNYLLFLLKIEGEIEDFQPVNSLHHYFKFLQVINWRVLMRSRETFEGSDDTEILNHYLQKLQDLQDNSGTFRVNLVEFEEVIEHLGLNILSQWDQYVIFQSLINQKQSKVSKKMKVNLGDLKAYLKVIFNNESLLNQTDQNLLQTSNSRAPGGDSLIRESQAFRKSMANLDTSQINKSKNSIHSTSRFREDNNLLGGDDKPSRFTQNSPPLRSNTAIPNKVKTGRSTYTFEIKILGVKELALERGCDFSDMTLHYKFPGEEQHLETQCFTYVPGDENYRVFLSSKHSIKSGSDKSVQKIFEEEKGLKIFLAKSSHSAKQINIAFTQIPSDELLSSKERTMTRFLYPLGDKRYSSSEIYGELELEIDCTVSDELLTEKDAFLQKRRIKNDKIMERDLQFERGLLPEGVFSLSIDRLSRLENTYGQLEKLVKQLNIDEDQENIKVSFQLMIETSNQMNDLQNKENSINSKKSDGSIEEISVREKSKSQKKSGRSSARRELELLFPKFSQVLSHKLCQSRAQILSFFESETRIEKLLNIRKYHDVKMTPKILEMISSEFLVISLRFTSTNLSCPQEKGRFVELGKVELPLDLIFTIQNQNGYCSSHDLVNISDQKIGALNLSMNYSKNADTQNPNQEIEDALKILDEELERLDRYSCFFRLAELVILHPEESWQGEVFFLRLTFGKKIDQTYLLQTPTKQQAEGVLQSDTNPELTRLKFVNHEKSKDMVFELEFGRTEEYISKEEIQLKMFQLGDEFDPLAVLPHLQIQLMKRDLDSGDEEYIGEISLDLRTTIQSIERGVKNEKSWNLRHFKNYSTIKKPYKRPKGPLDSCNMRLGFDMFVVKNDGQISNKVLKGFKEMLGQDWITSSKCYDQKVRLGVIQPTTNKENSQTKMKTSKNSTNSENQKEGLNEFSFRHGLENLANMPRFQIDSLQTLLKDAVMPQTDTEGKEGGPSRQVSMKAVVGGGFISEESYPVRSFGGLETDTEISNQALECLIIDPFMKDLQIHLKAQQVPLFRRLLKEFRYFDSDNSGYINFTDALKIYIEFSNQFVVRINPLSSYPHFSQSLQNTDYQGLKRTTLEKFQYNNLSYKNTIHADSPKQSLLNKFDYVIFLAQVLEEARSFDLGEVTYQDSGDQFNQDLEFVNEFSRQLDSMHHPLSKEKPEFLKSKEQRILEKDVERDIQRALNTKDITKETKYILSVLIMRAVNLDTLAGYQFPNTLVKIKFPYKQYQRAKIASKEGEMSARNANPIWDTALELKIDDNLQAFLTENRNSELSLEVIARELNHGSSSSMFNYRSLTEEPILINPLELLEPKVVQELLKGLILKAENSFEFGLGSQNCKVYGTIQLRRDSEDLVEDPLNQDFMNENRRLMDCVNRTADLELDIDQNNIAIPRGYSNLINEAIGYANPSNFEKTKEKRGSDSVNRFDPVSTDQHDWDGGLGPEDEDNVDNSRLDDVLNTLNDLRQSYNEREVEDSRDDI